MNDSDISNMKILMVHNHYQNPGGEDQVFDAEVSMLRANGQEVHTYIQHNDALETMSPFQRVKTAIWNNKSYSDIKKIIHQFHPDVVHFHNTFLCISPAAYHAAKALGMPVVQTIHNYRLLCPNALFFRNEHICEDCLNHCIQWPGIVNGCYRGSKSATSIVAFMNFYHNIIGSWKNKIDIYIALTEFAQQKFVRAGFPEEKIVVKPNFILADKKLMENEYQEECREGALFVGRLSSEKGIEVILKAWIESDMSIPLTIVGDGPMSERVRCAVNQRPFINWVGQQKNSDVQKLMRKASFLIMPSIAYETFGLVAVEAFANSVPVIASKIGAITEIITDSLNGLHVKPGDAEDLTAKVKWANGHPQEMMRMGKSARFEYESKYTTGQNYIALMDIYRKAITMNRTKVR